MGISTLILGESGTGKSASLRNMDPGKTLVIQAVKKPLPFRSKGWNKSVFCSDQPKQIINWLKAAAEKGKEVIVIDDFQYIMSNEYMARAMERGFDKFTEISYNAYSVIKAIESLPDNVRVYILSHTETTEHGKTKIKTIGKMLDEKITIEGLFTIVLRTSIQDKKYFLTTQNNGYDTVKTPMGMFGEELIDNDLNMIDQTIFGYYELEGSKTNGKTGDKAA